MASPINMWNAILAILVIFLWRTQAASICYTTPEVKSDCKYHCHCRNGTACNYLTGSCPSKCARGWFGPGCQYVALPFLVVRDSAYLDWLTNESDDVCNEGAIQSVSAVLRPWRSQILSWFRIVVNNKQVDLGDIRLEYKIDSGEQHECAPQAVSRVDDRTLDISCPTSERVREVTLSGPGVKSLCSLYISGGRNVALKQETKQSSTYTNQRSKEPFSSSKAVDGRVYSNSKDASLTCSHTIESEGKGQWNLTFWRPVELYKLTLNNRWYKGDQVICPRGKFGRECERYCNCASQNEACFVSTGGCPSGCAAGFTGEDCYTHAQDQTRQTVKFVAILGQDTKLHFDAYTYPAPHMLSLLRTTDNTTLTRSPRHLVEYVSLKVPPNLVTVTILNVTKEDFAYYSILMENGDENTFEIMFSLYEEVSRDENSKKMVPTVISAIGGIIVAILAVTIIILLRRNHALKKTLSAPEKLEKEIHAKRKNDNAHEPVLTPGVMFSPSDQVPVRIADELGTSGMCKTVRACSTNAEKGVEISKARSDLDKVASNNPTCGHDRKIYISTASIDSDDGYTSPITAHNLNGPYRNTCTLNASSFLGFSVHGSDDVDDEKAVATNTSDECDDNGYMLIASVPPDLSVRSNDCVDVNEQVICDNAGGQRKQKDDIYVSLRAALPTEQ